MNTEEEVHDQVRRAGVMAPYTQRQLSSLTCHVDLVQYLDGEYKSDSLTGVGVTFIADKPKQRLEVLPIFARSMVISRDSVRYLTLWKLVNLVTDGDTTDPNYMEVFGCKALCIAQFYDDKLEACPYTVGHRAMIENFIMDRWGTQRRLYIAIPVMPGQMTWWSSEFKAAIEANSKMIVC